MKINLEGLVWQVELADAHSPNLMVNSEPCRGTTWCGHQRIYISNELSVDCAMRVIRHEVTHAYIWSTQMVLPETFDEEWICNFISMWGPQILGASDQIFKALYIETCEDVQVDLSPEESIRRTVRQVTQYEVSPCV